MRLIGTLEEENLVRQFSLFLHQKGITHQIEERVLKTGEVQITAPLSFAFGLKKKRTLCRRLSG